MNISFQTHLVKCLKILLLNFFILDIVYLIVPLTAFWPFIDISIFFRETDKWICFPDLAVIVI